MRLRDVDEYGFGSIPVLATQLLDVTGPATKRRSGERAEDEHEWLADDERCELDRACVFEPDQSELRQRVPDVEPVGSAELRDRPDHDVAFLRRQCLCVLGVTRVEESAELPPLIAQVPLTVRLQALALRFALERGTNPDVAIEGPWDDPGLWAIGSPAT